MRKIILFITITLIGNFLFLEFAQAKKHTNEFTITPSILEVNVHPNEKMDLSITFINGFDQAIPFEVSLEDYPKYKNNKYSPVLKQRIKINTKNFIAAANEQEKVWLKINTPSIKHASYFYMVLFKPVPPPDFFEKHATRTIPYIAALLIVNVGDKNSPTLETIRIDKFSTSYDSKANRVRNQLSYSNPNNYYQAIEGEIIISDILGGVRDYLYIPQQNLMPKRGQEIVEYGQNTLGTGIYKSKLTVAGDNFTIYKNNYFVVWPSFGQLLSFLGIVSLLFIMHKLQQQKRYVYRF